MYKISFLIISLFFCTAYAEDFTIEDDLTKSSAEVLSAVKAGDKHFSEVFNECALEGKIAELVAGKPDSGYIATTSNACGWGASSGPIWVLLKDAQGSRVVLSTGGYALNLSKNTAEGEMRSVKVVGGGAGSATEMNYAFKGKQYLPIRSGK